VNITIEGARFDDVVAALVASGVACTVEERDESGTIVHRAQKIAPLPLGIRCYVRPNGCDIKASDVDAVFRQILAL